MDLAIFFKKTSDLAEFIDKNSEALYAHLTQYETYDAARDEIARSIECLKGLEKEFSQTSLTLHGLNICTFFPLNLPLYSLILFGIAPSAFCKTLYIRPPEVMLGILKDLWELLSISERFPTISLKFAPRHIFVQLYAAEADAIIFTGKYHNALDIHEKCPQSLVLYNGSGVNPFLIFENADVNLAAKKAVEMRCFNSGQDCAGPDAFIVHSSVAEKFTEKLKQQLNDIKVGNTTDRSVQIGQTMKKSYINDLKSWLKENEDYIIYGGEIDEANSLVYPTIVKKTVGPDQIESFHEFFAPCFYLLVYSNEEDLHHLLANESLVKRAMYISTFGENVALTSQITSARVLHNQIVNDVERGNTEYGGYGEEANFLLYGDKKIIKPVLLSRDLHLMLR